MALYYLTDDVILGWLSSPEMVRRFESCLKTASESIRPKKAGCGKCGSARAVANVDLDGIKRCLSQMPADKRAELKSMIGADKLRYSFNRLHNGNHRKVEMTF